MPKKKLTPNKLLTELLTEIGNEKTSRAVIDGRVVKVTKAESVARAMYEQAEGGMVEKVNTKGEVVEVFVKPNPAAARLIREYTEGKPSADIAKEAADKKKAGQLGSGTRKRLGEILNKPKPKTNAVPVRPTTKQE